MRGRFPGAVGAWRRSAICVAAAGALAACASMPAGDQRQAATAEVQILAINDFHGNLEVPAAEAVYHANGARVSATLGGAARLAATLDARRRSQAHTITVAAGDLVGASPLVSAYFLDEPTVLALNSAGLELAAVGNHEFDRGVDELRRLQEGGCEAFTQRQPCQLDRAFAGAAFSFLAANVLDEAGNPLFAGTALRQFGEIEIGFVGMTLKETGLLTSPAATAGYRFADEAETANARAAELTAQGADLVVLLLHQGGDVDPFFNQDACPGLGGAILPILERLAPEIRLVVSGHTHKAYICDVPTRAGETRLLTSAGRYGYFVTDIRLQLEPATGRIVSLNAVNVPVVEAGGERADVAALVARYRAASEEVGSRQVGRIVGALEAEGALDAPLARMVADAQLAATSDSANGGARIAFINSGGVRAGFTRADDGTVSYNQLFALQPFGNILQVLELSGSELKQVLEEEFDEAGAPRQSLLIPSHGFRYAFDATAPVGQRIVEMRLDGAPVDPQAIYRVTVNNFLANGGDGFATFVKARFIADGGADLDALTAFVSRGVVLEEEPRVIDRSPAGSRN